MPVEGVGIRVFDLIEHVFVTGEADGVPVMYCGTVVGELEGLNGFAAD